MADTEGPGAREAESGNGEPSGGGPAGSHQPQNPARAGSGFREWLSRPEVMIGLSAVVLSVCGLFVSIYETSLIRQEQRASVWPRVEVGSSFNDEGVRFHVRNTGVGPARVRAAAVIHGGDTLGDWTDMLRSVAGGGVELRGRTYSLINGRVLPPDPQREVIFEIEEDEVVAPEGLLDSLQRSVLDGSVDVTVCYCSVYDECWISALQGLQARMRGEWSSTGTARVESCAAAARSRI